jgi:DNA-binding beta-propeller fold protein YncE
LLRMLAVTAVCSAFSTAVPDDAAASHRVTVRAIASPSSWRGMGLAGFDFELSRNRDAYWLADIRVIAESTKECDRWEITVSGVEGGGYHRFEGSARRREVHTGMNAPYGRDYREIRVQAQCGGLDPARDEDWVYVAAPPWPSDQPAPGKWLTQSWKDNIGAGTLLSGATAIAVCAYTAWVPGVGWGACGLAVATTAVGALILAVDPPDPNFDSVALPRPLPAAPVRVRCRRLPTKRLRAKRACRRLRDALARYQDAAADAAALVEAVGVATNRFTAARDANDLGGQLLQAGVRKVYARELIDAYARQSAAGAALAREMRRGRIDVRLNARRMARAVRRLRALRGVPGPIVDRLRQVVDVDEAMEYVLSRLPERRALSLRRLLAEPLPTAGFEDDYRSVTPTEAALVAQAALDAEPGDAALAETRDHLARMVASCEPAVREREGDEAAAAAGRAAGEYGRFVQLAVEPVAALPAELPDGCPPPVVGPFSEFGGFGSDAGQFKVPTDVVVAGDAIYVADQQNFRIQKFTRDGTYVRHWGGEATSASSLEPGKFSTPVGVAVDSAGNVYVTDFEQSRVQKFTSEGVFVKAWGTYGSGDGQFRNAAGIAIDRHDRIYVVDANGSRIQQFTTTGAFVRAIGAGDGLSSPRGITTDVSGNVYVANRDENEVVVFASDGSVLRRWGTPGTEGPGRFNGVYDVAIDPSGNVWAADRANGRLQKFTRHGDYLGEESSFDQTRQSFEPMAVATDGDHGVYAADLERDRIVRFGDRR